MYICFPCFAMAMCLEAHVLHKIRLRQGKAAKVVGWIFFDIFDAFQHTISLPAW